MCLILALPPFPSFVLLFLVEDEAVLSTPACLQRRKERVRYAASLPPECAVLVIRLFPFPVQFKKYAASVA
jgi:hypothetical protein